MIRPFIAAVMTCIALWGAAMDAIADHLVFLPYTPNTPLMQQEIKNQTYNWCVDSRASAYPAFVSQLQDVAAQYTQRVGVKSTQVPWGDATCMVKHTMPDDFSCGPGAAACIYYANWPVVIEYDYHLGYFDWRSAQGHELGHGLLGLHEMYRDSGGTIGCTGRQDTVMDCGSGVKYPTSLDVTRGCSIILTAWCGKAPDLNYPFWDGVRWQFVDKWSFDPAYGNCGGWYNPLNQLAWADCDASWGGRWNPLFRLWVGQKDSYDPSTNLWYNGFGGHP